MTPGWCAEHQRPPGDPHWAVTTEHAAAEVRYDCGCHWVWYALAQADGTTSYRRVELGVDDYASGDQSGE